MGNFLGKIGEKGLVKGSENLSVAVVKGSENVSTSLENGSFYIERGLESGIAKGKQFKDWVICHCCIWQVATDLP